MDLEQSIDELQALVSKYDTENFAGFFAHFIKRRANFADDTDLNLFQSKQKEFLYLISLNVFAAATGTEKLKAGDKDIRKMAELLKQINSFYNPENSTDYTHESIIHELALQNHFDNGVLSYVEQDIEKIRRVFQRYESYIREQLGFDLAFLTEVFKEIELISAIRLKHTTAFTHSKEYNDFHKGMMAKKEGSRRAFDLLPEEIQEAFHRFHFKPYAHLIFTAKDLYPRLPAEQVDRFLDLFSIAPGINPQVRYYTAEGPFELAPILRLPNNQYLNLCQKQIPVAIYTWLYAEISKDIKFKDKLRRHRENNLEQKVVEIFKSFFPGRETFFYGNYYIDQNYEQDLLIIYKGTAIIVEVKASRLREPFRNSAKAMPRLQNDFKDSIQYGFDQCVRVEDHFFGTEPFAIKDENKKVLFTMNPNRIRNVYSIVVTLERFGSLQTDLSLMLKKEENVDYPWSVYIDDLEIFLTALKSKVNNHTGKFIEFLELRRLYHGKSHAIDELDVCGYFIRNPDQFKNCADSNDTYYTFSPYEQGLFDELYYAGILKFKERPLPDEFYQFGI